MTWKRLEECWKHSDCDLRFKSSAYGAAIRAKLMYGLESLQPNEDLKNKTDVFQRQGLRTIMRATTTCGQKVTGEAKTNTNDWLYAHVNATINTMEVRKASECMGKKIK